MEQKVKHISMLFLLALLYCAPAKAEPFGQFLIKFLSQPSTQGKKASHNLKINDRKANKDGNYITMSPVAIVCSDSIDSPYMNEPRTLAIVNLSNKDYNILEFARVGKTYQFTNSRVSKAAFDYDFVTFLNEYSRNHDLQMKRTIFPMPIRQFNGKKEGDSKLLMPREWKYIDFSGITPELCLASSDYANNRRIYIYNSGKLTQVYNFICINKKWYLIEVENH